MDSPSLCKQDVKLKLCPHSCAPPRAMYTKDLSKEERRKLFVVMAFCCLGNILEWYDFGLFGLLASYIGETFFPTENKQLYIIETFVVWAGSFAMRPIGGVIFAYIGDKYSRKLAVYLALMCISFGTGLIGCIPSYDTIGITATILMTVLRLVQGLAVGGQFVGTMIYVNEHAPVKERAYYGSVNFGATLLGSLFANVILIILSSVFTDTQITDYAWRIPFIGGLLFLPFGIWLHNHAPDTNANTNVNANAAFDHLELLQTSSEEENEDQIDYCDDPKIAVDNLKDEEEKVMKEPEDVLDNIAIENLTCTSLNDSGSTSSDGLLSGIKNDNHNNSQQDNNKKEKMKILSSLNMNSSTPTTTVNDIDTMIQVAVENKTKFFLWEVLKHDWGKMLVLASVVGIWSTAYYTMYVWMITYLREFRVDSPIEARYNINATWTLFLSIVIPLIGSFTDKIGVVQTMTFGTIFASFTAILGFIMLQKANINENPNDIYLLWFFQGPVSLAMAFVAAPLSTFVSALNCTSSFNYTFLAASYNLAQVLYGGVSPIVATALIHTFNGYGPCIWIITCNLLGLVGLAYVLFFNKSLYHNVNIGASLSHI